MNNYSVAKSTTERYSIRFDSIWTWAIINISENGDFNVISDYGNYSYAWRNFGDNFKKFLIELGERCKEHPTSYLYSKIHNKALDDKIDIEGTIENIKKEIFNRRRDKDITEEVARECWNEIVSFVDDYGSSGECSYDFFYANIGGEATDNVFCNNYELLSLYAKYTYDRDCEAFCKEIMPVFTEILKDEMILK
jgi:hypothetical protein